MCETEVNFSHTGGTSNVKQGTSGVRLRTLLVGKCFTHDAVTLGFWREICFASINV